MFGSSWMTSAVGYLVIVLTVAHQVYTEGGLPSGVDGWVVFGGKIMTGVGIALAKDFNKTNAPAPEAQAKPANG